VMSDMQDNASFMPSPEQSKFAEKWLDYSKRQTLKDVAKEIGIAHSTIWRWHQNPDFVKWINNQSFEMLKSSLNGVYRALVRKAESGDVHAIKLYLENIGEFVEKSEITIGWKE